MSKIALTPNASGSGTFTIASPNSNTDRTLTLPDEAGTVLTSVSDVAFHVEATGTNQSVAAATDTTVQWENVKLDTHAYWDSTNHRFTPQVAGWYFFSGNVRLNVDAATEQYIRIEMRRNNETSPRNLVAQIQHSASTLQNGNYNAPSGLILLNGTTDYVEMIVHTDTACTVHDAGAYPSYMSGFLVRRT